jgi:hypothetical protein
MHAKLGSLHVKCATAGSHSTSLSSVNFNEYVFTINVDWVC